MKRRFLISVILIMVGTLFLVGCGRQKTAAEIRVGVVHAQTGMFAAFGQGGVFGIKAAVEDINKQGGVNVGGTKIPIKLIIVDNASEDGTCDLIEQEFLQVDLIRNPSNEGFARANNVGLKKQREISSSSLIALLTPSYSKTGSPMFIAFL
jgi:hypothetical protein